MVLDPKDPVELQEQPERRVKQGSQEAPEELVILDVTENQDHKVSMEKMVTKDHLVQE